MSDLSNHYIGRNNDYSEYPPDGGCLGSVLACLLALAVFGIITLFFGCSRTQYVTREVPVVLHDTLVRERVSIDTFIARDSVWREVYQNGDTIFLHDGAIQYRDRVKLLHDTITKVQYVPQEIYVEVEKPVQVTKEVRKPLAPWEKAFVLIGIASALAVLIKLLYYIYTRTRAKSAIAWLINHVRK